MQSGWGQINYHFVTQKTIRIWGRARLKGPSKGLRAHRAAPGRNPPCLRPRPPGVPRKAKMGKKAPPPSAYGIRYLSMGQILFSFRALYVFFFRAIRCVAQTRTPNKNTNCGFFDEIKNNQVAQTPPRRLELRTPRPPQRATIKNNQSLEVFLS